MVSRKPHTQIFKTSSKYDLLLERAIQLHQAGHLVQAEELYKKLLEKKPKNAHALHLLGLIAKTRGDLQNAVTLVKKALTFNPSNASYHLNLGLIYAQGKNNSQAKASFQQAHKLDPLLADALFNLGVLSQQEKNYEIAEKYYKSLLEIYPNHLKTLNNLGEVLNLTNNVEQGIIYLRKALSIQSDFLPALYNLGLALLSSQKTSDIQEACIALEQVANRANNSDAWFALANARVRLNYLNEAVDAYDKALDVQPDFISAINNKGLTLIQLGQIKLARQTLLSAMKFSPIQARTLYNFALVVEKEQVHELKKCILNELENDTLCTDSKSLLHFALGHLLDGEKQYHQAFLTFKMANLTHDTKYDSTSHRNNINQLISRFDENLFIKYKELGCKSNAPLFIVGMPRSGTTLVEQIISAHPNVYGAGESNELNDIAGRLSSVNEPPYDLAALDNNLVAEIHDIGMGYIKKLMPNNPDILTFTDKMTTNFLHLGLIALLLPNARVIHCRRDPIATCMSCFTNHFEGDLPFTYDLSDLGNYYRDYLSLMAHWRNILPIKMFEIDYEHLVTMPNKVIPSLISYCGLEWNELCLNPHENKRPVSTASFVQIRKPINNTSLNRWEHYSPWITELLNAIDN